MGNFLGYSGTTFPNKIVSTLHEEALQQLPQHMSQGGQQCSPHKKMGERSLPTEDLENCHNCV